MRFAISLFTSIRDNKPVQVQRTWEEMCEEFTHPVIRSSKDGLLFSPAIFDPAKRKKENVKELSMLVLDYDHQASFENDLNVWRELNICLAAYTTHSHRITSDSNPKAEERFRVVIPLAEPISKRLFGELWKWAAGVSKDKINTQAKDESRIFYRPVKSATDAPYEYRVMDGKLLDWRELGLEIEADSDNANPCKQRQQRSAKGSGYETWDALWAEWGRRLIAHSSARRNSTGNWDCQGICHDGKGNSGLVYFPQRNRGHCNNGCDGAAMLRAFGLPELPNSELARSNGRVEPASETKKAATNLKQRIEAIISAKDKKRDDLIRALVRDLVSNADTLTIKRAGKELKNGKALSLEIYSQLVREERERQRLQKQLAAQNKDKAKREAKLQELINTECNLSIIHRKLTQITSSPHSHDVIELAMAASIGHLLSSEVLLWLLIVGPPSSDKTHTALAIKDAPHVIHLDTLTENAFISGFVSPDGSLVQDLLAELDKCCLTIKDLNSLFGQHPDKVAKVLGDLTAIYDGEFAKWTGTRGNVSYKARFSLIGCVTPITLANHHRYMNMIGARFLSYRVAELSSDSVNEGFDTIWRGTSEAKFQLRQLASAYVTQLHQVIGEKTLAIPTFSENARRSLNALATFLAYARASVRTQRSEITTDSGKTATAYDIVEVQREEPFRALLQLRTLAKALAIIHRRSEVTEHELELCRRVVLSSMPYDRSLILALFQNSEYLTQDSGLTRKAAAEGIGKARNQAIRLLTELDAINVLKKEKLHDADQDVDIWTYYPASEEFTNILAKPTQPLDHEKDLDFISTLA